MLPTLRPVRPSRMARGLRTLALGGLLGSLLPALQAQPAADPALPAVRHAGGVAYLTGGIGSDESRALRAASRSWPLALEFGRRAGGRVGYVASVAVTVQDAAGRFVLDLRSEGPFLLAQLPPGRYRVSASYADQIQLRELEVTPGRPARASFVWDGAP